MINGFAFYSYLPIVWLHKVVFFVLVVAVVFFGLFNRHDYKYLIINFYFKKLRFHFHLCFLCIRTPTHRPTHAWLKWHFRFKVNDWPNRKRWKVVLLLLFVGHFLNQHANTVRACQRIFDSLFFPGDTCITAVAVAIQSLIIKQYHWWRSVHERAKENEWFFLARIEERFNFGHFSMTEILNCYDTSATILRSWQIPKIH